jgi:uncharacterized protein
VAESLPLPVVSCTGPPCGCCCLHLGSPPGVLFDLRGAAVAEVQGLPMEQWPLSEWGRSLPADALAAVLAHYREPRPGAAGPCCWYDAATRRCRHYESRPGACREFEPGGESCLATRSFYRRLGCV